MQALLTESFTDFEDLRGKAEKILSSILSKKSLEQYWKNLIMDSFLGILPEIYELEGNIIDGGYSFMMAEVSVEGEIVKGIKLKGKIDRIDRKVQNSMSKIPNLKYSNVATRHPSLVNDIVEIIV